jgi:hypothetical protein
MAKKRINSTQKAIRSGARQANRQMGKSNG